MPKELGGSPPSCITFCKEVWLSPFSLRERRRNGYRTSNPTQTSGQGSSAAAPRPFKGDEGKADVPPALENPDRPGRPWVRGMCSQAGPGHWKSRVKIIELVSLFYAEIFQLAVGALFFHAHENICLRSKRHRIPLSQVSFGWRKRPDGFSSPPSCMHLFPELCHLASVHLYSDPFLT